MTEIEKAYIAGLLDGEGSIIITKHERNYYRKQGEKRFFTRRVMAYSLLIKVCMLSKPAVQFFAEKASGNLTKQKAGWHCAIWHRKAYNFLKEILPYLITKKPQAEFVIWCYENIFSRAFRENYMCSVEDWKIQELCYEVSKLFNNKDSLSWHGKGDEFGEKLKSLLTMLTPSQASVGLDTEEGVTTTQVRPNNNPEQETPPIQKEWMT